MTAKANIVIYVIYNGGKQKKQTHFQLLVMFYKRFYKSNVCISEIISGHVNAQVVFR